MSSWGSGPTQLRRVEADAGRRARRAFIRDHHPDRGGDPQTFLAGLARFDRTGSGPAGPEVGFFRRPRGPARLLAWLRVQHRPPRPSRVH